MGGDKFGVNTMRDKQVTMDAQRKMSKCAHTKLPKAHKIEAHHQSECVLGPNCVFCRMPFVTLPHIHLDRICNGTGKDAAASQAGSLNVSHRRADASVAETNERSNWVVCDV